MAKQMVFESDARDAIRRGVEKLAKAVVTTLGPRGRNAILCVTDTDEGDTPFVATAACGYVRLRRTHYDDDDLRGWVGQIASKGLPKTYVYFMHEDEALGTRFGRRLNELWAEAGA